MSRQILFQTVKLPLLKLSFSRYNHHLPLVNLVIFIIVFAGLGGYLIYTSFAASITNVAVINASAMNYTVPGFPGHPNTIFSDKSAVSGHELGMYWGGSATQKVVTGSAVNQITISAKGQSCNGSAFMSLAVDGNTVKTWTAITTSLASYTAAANLPAGTHTVTVTFPNDYYTGPKCDRNLYLDVIYLQNSQITNSTQPPIVPSLALNGSTISWSAQKGATGYQGAISNGPRSTTARTTSYLNLGNVTSWTPPAKCGQTLYYGVAADGGPWSSNEVSITWPACVVATPPPTVTPTPTSNTSTSGLRVAVNDIAVRHYISGVVNDFKNAGVNWDRVDIGNGSDFSLVDLALNLGIKPLVVYNVNMTGMAPATTAAQVRSAAQQMQARGLHEIEFGNEIYCNGCNGWKINPPEAYAAQYAAAHAAIAGMGMTLIANATGDYQTASGSWSQDASGHGWIHDFLAAMPGGPAVVDAWSIHPYGPIGSMTQGETGGWPTVPRYHSLAMQYGSNAPWYITEVAQRLSDVSQDQQATDMTQYLDDTYNKYPWVVYIAWYETTDDSTGTWGLINVDNSTQTVTGVRPAFNALKSWMAAHPNIKG